MPIRRGTYTHDLLVHKNRAKEHYDENGEELVDNTPIEPPIGFVEQPPLHELIRQMVRNEQIRQAINSEAESFEEADDFDVGDDDPFPNSPYEEIFDPPPPPSETKKSRAKKSADESTAPTTPVDTEE